MDNIKKVIVTTIISLFVLVATAIVFANQPPNIQPSAVVVKTIKVQPNTDYDTITTTGNIIAVPGIMVKSEISGCITNTYFNSGSRVNANTPLVEIYPDIIKAQFAQAQAELKLAQLNFERMKKLHKTHAISDIEYDKTNSILESAQAKADQYQANLKQTVVRAPFDGRLGISLVSVGQYIDAGQNIVSLQSLDPIYVDFSIPEIYASKVSLEQTIKVHSSIYPSEVFEGKVSAIDPLVNKDTRSLTIRAAIPNTQEKLLPGSFADVSLFTSGKKQTIKIPQIAIIYETAGSYVYKVLNGKVFKTPVTLGKHDAQDVVVEKGLNVNDEIVTEGQMKIHQEGESVVVAPTQTS